MKKRTTKAQYQTDLLLLTEFLNQIGGRRVADVCFTKWEVPTIFGPLTVTVSPGLNFVAARFAVIPDKQHPLIDRLPARDLLNTFSGKWNCTIARNGLLDLHESVLAFLDRLERILAAPEIKTKINERTKS